MFKYTKKVSNVILSLLKGLTLGQDCFRLKALFREPYFCLSWLKPDPSQTRDIAKHSLYKCSEERIRTMPTKMKASYVSVCEINVQHARKPCFSMA